MVNLRHALVPALALCLVSSWLAPAADAKTVTYRYTGIADESEGVSTGIFAFASEGTLLSGTISFDDRLFDQIGSGAEDAFANNTPIENRAYSESFVATLQVGAIMLTQVATEATLPQASLALTDASPGNTDSVVYQMIRTSPTVLGNDFFALRFFDPTGTAVGAGGSGLSQAIEGAIAILDALDVADFDDEAVPLSRWRARDETDQDLGRIVFRVTGFSRVQEVPSLSAPWSLMVGALVACALVLRSRGTAH